MMGFAYRLILGCLLVLVIANHADAAPTPEQRLNTIASSVAGKPVLVHCTFNAEDWDKQVQDASFGQRRGSSVGGYARAGSSDAYLGPFSCYALYDVLSGGVVYAGLNPSAFGLLTLLHEAAHLRGSVNEGETDCTALGLFKSYLDDIGVPATVSKAVNVKGRYITKRVVNPHIRLLGIFAQAIHDKRPPEYRGSC